MKTVLPLLLILALHCLPTASLVRAQNNLADVIEQAEKSVLRIEVKGLTGDGLGSGYVVQDDGMFVTNVHVMAGAREAVAHFANGDSAKIIGTWVIDKNRDICVCQLEGGDYAPIHFSSNTSRKGETVIALGAPHGLSFSATTGIVSAIRGEKEARQQMGRPNLEGTWIQVDAALSPGNSGGPLINQQGDVVGMSTLASSGRAQNLNFGISAGDIRTAVSKARQSQLTEFRDGIGNVKMGGGDSGNSTGGTEKFITRTPIPEVALAQYVQAGKEQYKELSREIRKASTKATARLRDYKRGETYIPRGGQSDFIVLKNKSKDRYFFRDERTKKRLVAQQQERAEQLSSVRKQLSPAMDNHSLVTLLMNAGPDLDARAPQSIGCISDAVVVHAYNDHEILVAYDQIPFIMWVESTSGLARGSALTPTPVFVAGTHTVSIPEKGTRSVTILTTVSESDIRRAVAGFDNGTIAGGPAAAEFRVWTDRTGKYTFEAVFVEAGPEKVVLKNRKDKIITVPLAKLSKDDLELIEQYKK